MHVEPFKRSQRAATKETVVVVDHGRWKQGTADRPEQPLGQFGVVAFIPHRHISG